jgi:hypothetical protein
VFDRQTAVCQQPTPFETADTFADIDLKFMKLSAFSRKSLKATRQTTNSCPSGEYKGELDNQLKAHLGSVVKIQRGSWSSDLRIDRSCKAFITALNKDSLGFQVPCQNPTFDGAKNMMAIYFDPISMTSGSINGSSQFF